MFRDIQLLHRQGVRKVGRGVFSLVGDRSNEQRASVESFSRVLPKRELITTRAVSRWLLIQLVVMETLRCLFREEQKMRVAHNICQVQFYYSVVPGCLFALFFSRVFLVPASSCVGLLCICPECTFALLARSINDTANVAAAPALTHLTFVIFRSKHGERACGAPIARCHKALLNTPPASFFFLFFFLRLRMCRFFMAVSYRLFRVLVGFMRDWFLFSGQADQSEPLLILEVSLFDIVGFKGGGGWYLDRTFP